MGAANNRPFAPQPWRYPRKHPRVSLEIPVELQAGNIRVIARSADVSVGGLLLRTSRTWQPGTELAVRFNLPDGRFISCVAKVVHETSGAKMGLEFSQLRRECRSVLADFTCRMSRYVRRGDRIARRYYLLVRGSSPAHAQKELAETVLISPHGGLLVCRIPYDVDEQIHIWWPERGRDTGARIVSRRECASRDLIELGFRFENGDGFWDSDLRSPAER